MPIQIQPAKVTKTFAAVANADGCELLVGIAELISTAIESNDTRALLAVLVWLRLDCWP